MKNKDRNLFNLDDFDNSESNELKSKHDASSMDTTLDTFETDEIDKEEMLALKIKEAAEKRKLENQKIYG